MIYSPVDFPKQFDPEGNFIRHYVPALKNFPATYIFEPWKAPLEVQKAAGCILGRDYPLRIVEHEAAQQLNVHKLKATHQKYKCPSISPFLFLFVFLSEDLAKTYFLSFFFFLNCNNNRNRSFPYGKPKARQLPSLNAAKNQIKTVQTSKGRLEEGKAHKAKKSASNQRSNSLSPSPSPSSSPFPSPWLSLSPSPHPSLSPPRNTQLSSEEAHGAQILASFNSSPVSSRKSE